MDSILTDHECFVQDASLCSSIDSIQQLIDSIEISRRAYVQTSEFTAKTVSEIQRHVKRSFESINTNLKDIHKMTQHQNKSLERRFRPRSGQIVEPIDNISNRLLSRAIAMHLLREGQFNVADKFLVEFNRAPSSNPEQDEAQGFTAGSLKKDFLSMYSILRQMRVHHDLAPATIWASSNSLSLQARGSNLEFELAKLQFLRHLTEAVENGLELRERQIAAISYARTSMSKFGNRYIHEIQQLMGAMTFCADLINSPYQGIVQLASAWEEVALIFTREFCSLLGLSADSPLSITTTAGVMALPMLEKLRLIMKEKRTEWTTEHELPVEIPLPLSYRFHPIFVCPVSKEQTTDRNPPMLLPCGHVVAKESLNRLSKTAKFKCPYCPEEAQQKDAREVVL